MRSGGTPPQHAELRRPPTAPHPIPRSPVSPPQTPRLPLVAKPIMSTRSITSSSPSGCRRAGSSPKGTSSRHSSASSPPRPHRDPSTPSTLLDVTPPASRTSSRFSPTATRDRQSRPPLLRVNATALREAWRGGHRRGGYRHPRPRSPLPWPTSPSADRGTQLPRRTLPPPVSRSLVAPRDQRPRPRRPRRRIHRRRVFALFPPPLPHDASPKWVHNRTSLPLPIARSPSSPS
jgi:hypothetical protein